MIKNERILLLRNRHAQEDSLNVLWRFPLQRHWHPATDHQCAYIYATCQHTRRASTISLRLGKL